MILGIPIDLVIKDKLISVIKDDTIYYYPSEESIYDSINIVSQIQLRYLSNPLLEYADIGDYDSLLAREKEMIDNIKNNPNLLE